MLAYPLDEAETLLDGRLGNANKSLENCEEDLEFLREQITVCLHGSPFDDFPSFTRDTDHLVWQTMEVAIARVYNWDVVQKRKEKAEDESKGKENEKSGG